MTQTVSVMPHWLRKLREWAGRYLPAEIMGTVSAVVAAIAAFEITGERAVAAVIGAAAEGVGFYGPMAIREWRRQRRTGRPQTLPTAARTLRVMFAEFGPAEALDLVVRPMCLYVSGLLTNGIGLGSMLGKLMADAVFYGVAIANYEMTQRRSRMPSKDWHGVEAKCVVAV